MHADLVRERQRTSRSRVLEIRNTLQTDQVGGLGPCGFKDSIGEAAVTVDVDLWQSETLPGWVVPQTAQRLVAVRRRKAGAARTASARVMMTFELRGAASLGAEHDDLAERRSSPAKSGGS